MHRQRRDFIPSSRNPLFQTPRYVCPITVARHALCRITINRWVRDDVGMNLVRILSDVEVVFSARFRSLNCCHLRSQSLRHQTFNHFDYLTSFRSSLCMAPVLHSRSCVAHEIQVVVIFCRLRENERPDIVIIRLKNPTLDGSWTAGNIKYDRGPLLRGKNGMEYSWRYCAYMVTVKSEIWCIVAPIVFISTGICREWRNMILLLRWYWSPVFFHSRIPVDGSNASQMLQAGTPKSLPKFEHPSHSLLKEKGFTQQVYGRFRTKCFKGGCAIGSCWFYLLLTPRIRNWSKTEIANCILSSGCTQCAKHRYSILEIFLVVD